MHIYVAKYKVAKCIIYSFVERKDIGNGGT